MSKRHHKDKARNDSNNEILNTYGLDATTAAFMANAKAKGKRPEYFQDAMSEHHFSITMALVAELAVARERIDTLERVLVSKGIIDTEDVENFIPDARAEEQRQLAQVEYTARIFRALQQALECIDENDKSMEEMAEILGKKND